MRKTDRVRANKDALCSPEGIRPLTSSLIVSQPGSACLEPRDKSYLDSGLGFEVDVPEQHLPQHAPQAHDINNLPD